MLNAAIRVSKEAVIGETCFVMLVQQNEITENYSAWLQGFSGSIPMKSTHSFVDLAHRIPDLNSFNRAVWQRDVGSLCIERIGGQIVAVLNCVPVPILLLAQPVVVIGIVEQQPLLVVTNESKAVRPRRSNSERCRLN